MLLLTDISCIYYIDRESDMTKERIEKLLKAGANVVLTTKGIDDMALKATSPKLLFFTCTLLKGSISWCIILIMVLLVGFNLKLRVLQNLGNHMLCMPIISPYLYHDLV